MKKTFTETFLKTIDSTQLYSKRVFHECPQNHWQIVVAETQTGGLGQYNRKWISPPNNLYATFTFPFPQSQLEALPCVTQVAAVSVCQALESFKIKGQIKWKNDVLINRKKICGILAEAETFGNSTLVYTGIGVNINMTAEEAENVNQPSTSMRMELGKEMDKKAVYEVIRDKLMLNIDILKEKGFSQFLTYINTNSVAFGKIVRVKDHEGYESKGEFLGLDQRGFLVLKTDDGALLVLSTGQMIVEDK